MYIDKKHIIISTLLYIFVYFYAYITFLFPYFEYAGFQYSNKNFFEIIIAITLAFLPCLFYKEGKISSFISIFIFILLYIPIIFSFTFIADNISLRDYLLQLSFFIGMVSFFRVGSINMTKAIKLPTMLFDKKIILILSIFFSLIVIIIYRDNLKFASFNDVYDLREENNKLSQGNNFLGYLNVWMTNFFMPICLAYGIVYKNKLYFYVGVLIAIVLYTSTGAKIAILFPLVYLFFNFLSKRKLIDKFFCSLVYSISATILLLLLLLKLFPSNEFIFLMNSVVISRTIANGGLLTFWYDDFFQNNPYTYYAHINLINMISQTYPYDTELGFVIGGAYWNEKMNANANFWATDGIASLGIVGVLIINVIVTMILFFLDFVSINKNKLFVILLFLPFISMFLNTSIFTALVSGGAFLSVIFILNFKK